MNGAHHTLDRATMPDHSTTFARSAIRFALGTLFLLLIFSLGFMQPNLDIRGLSVTVTDLIFIVTCAIWFVALVFRQIEFRFDKSYVFLGLYAFGLLLSAAFSENPRFSLLKYLGEIYLIGLSVMTFNLTRTREVLKKVLVLWLAASSVTALVGALTVFFFYLGFSNALTEFSLHHYGSLVPGNYPRIESTFIYPSMLCNYLTVGLLMLLAARRSGWVTGRPFTALTLMFSITIAFTLTPGIGGVLLGVALWFWFIFNERGRPVLPRVILSGGVFAGSCFLLVSTFTVINTPTSPFYFHAGGVRIDPTQRLLTWQAAFHTFLDHPFFGKGLGLGVAEVYFMPPSGQMQLLTDAHNAFLSVAGQAGILGAIPLVLMCTAVIRRSRLFQFDGGDVSTISLCLGIAFVSALLYQGLVGSFEDARHLWVLIGLILSVSRLTESSPAILDSTIH